MSQKKNSSIEQKNSLNEPKFSSTEQKKIQMKKIVQMSKK